MPSDCLSNFFSYSFYSILSAEFFFFKNGKKMLLHISFADVWRENCIKPVLIFSVSCFTVTTGWVVHSVG